MLDSEEIAEKLQRLRLRHFGENIRHFERQTGISRGSVEHVEKDKGFPSLEVLAKWLEVCKTSFAHFFEEFEPFPPVKSTATGYKTQHKRHHDRLEFVLSSVGPKDSATIATLKLEYEKAISVARPQGEKEPAQQPGGQ